MTQNNNPQMNLRQKLFEIRKSISTFAQSEPSEKKDNSGKSAYKYTPGWQIVETIKKKMDDLGVMLEPSLQSESHEMISYPVYKEIGGKIIPFEKKEMYVNIVMAYTFVDVDSSQTAGPFLQPAAGANGTKVTITTREILETDNDALLSLSTCLPEYKALLAALPPYVKLSLAVDKTALKTYIKVNTDILLQHPEWVHTKENKSVSLK